MAGILLTIGKYLFVALLYVFVVLVFRALMIQAQADARVRRRVISGPQRPPQEVPPPVSEPAPRPAALTPEPEPQPHLPMLVVQRSAEADVQAGHRYPLGATVTLGRGPHNTIVLSDRYVSKDHAIIYLQDGWHLLCDQNSTNGTYLNGARITEPVPLANGDEISIGTTVFTHQAEE